MYPQSPTRGRGSNIDSLPSSTNGTTYNRGTAVHPTFTGGPCTLPEPNSDPCRGSLLVMIIIFGRLSEDEMELNQVRGGRDARASQR